MMCEQGGIPFPLNNLPCQCGPNWALLQGCVLSLSNQRESLTIAARNDKRELITAVFLVKNMTGPFSTQQAFQIVSWRLFGLQVNDYVIID